MKIILLPVVILCNMLLMSCDAGDVSSPDNPKSASTSGAETDTISILGYRSSGQLDKPIPAREDATTGSITIAVDESLKPVMQAMIEAFQFLFEDATIRAVFLPGEEAIAAMLTSDSIRLAISTRELRYEEEALLGNRGITAKYSHVFSDGIAMIAHPDMNGISLSNKQIESLLSGELNDWSQLGKSAGPIQMVVDHNASGVLMSLRSKYLDGKAVPSQQIFALDSSAQVFEYVSKTPSAIGFAGNAWISDRDNSTMQNRIKKIALIPLERTRESKNCQDDQNFFLPYQSYIYQGCYPLTRSVHSILRESTLGLGTGFVSFMDSPKGQLVIHKAGLATVHGIARKVKLPPQTEPTQGPTTSDSE